MMIIIRHKKTGESQCVHSLDGYDMRSWEVLEEGVARPRGDCVREIDPATGKGRWKVCRVSQEKASRVRRYHELGRQGVIELLDTLEKKVATIDDVMKRLEALEALEKSP